ncbi:MAG: transporter substrate-binding domain-containing protein [Oscillospiraceae bacterium]|nr:transporter substrate-binding domain-containing protein [Oscillospiraceae bacterium]
MKKLIAMLLALVMLFALCACGTTTEQPAETEEKKTLILGTSADYAPFEFMYPDEKGELVYGGIDVSVAEYIAEYNNMDLQIENMGFDYLLVSLQKGDFDIVIAAIEETEERLQSADFSDPYYTDYPPMILVKAENKDAYASLDDFVGKSVGAQTATTKEGIVKNDMTGANLVALQNVNDLVNQLINDKIDAVVLDGAVALQFVDANKDLAIASVDLGEAYPYRVAVAKGDPKGLLPGINAAIADMLAKDKVTEFTEQAGSLEDVWQEVSAE